MDNLKRDLTPNPVQDVADFFLVNAHPHHPVTPNKLQKLCAYAQAFSPVFNGCRLFDNPVEESPDGPVIRELQGKYPSCGRARIPSPPGLDNLFVRERFSPEQRFALDVVNSFYGGHTASQLRDKSRRDFPGTWSKKASHNPIPDEEIRARFANHPATAAMDRIVPAA